MMEQAKALNAAIVGGGHGCKAIAEMILAERLRQLQIKLIGVACTNSEAVGYRYAQNKGIYTTSDYRELYKLNDLNMIIELTGRDEVANEIFQTKPKHVRLIDHLAAYVFWNFFQIEEETIAECKKTQEEPWKSEEFGSAHLTNPHHPLIVINSDTSIRYVNPVLENLTGFSSSKLIGRKAPYPWWTKEILQKTGRDQVEVMQKEAQGIEKLFQRKNGKRFWVEVTSTPVRTDGRLKYYLVSWMDITERKRVEEALRISEEKYKTLTASSLTGIFIHRDGKYVFVNTKFAEIHGYKPEELLGKEFSTLISPAQRNLFAKMVSARLRGEAVSQRYEIQRLKKNGQTIWCEMMAVRIEYGGSPAIMGNIVDINNRKLVEKALQEREAALKAQAHELEEVNSALKVLLKHREKDRTNLKERILSNVKELVLPYVQTLKSSPLNVKQIAYVDIIESNLNTIISPFLQKLSSKYLGLTPKEIQVAGLVKEGRTNKEIAELFNISVRSVEFHRENIRTKFGLKNRKVNLRSYLLSLM